MWLLHNSRDSQHGMFLLEVLVSIVIVGFGLLGMAGLVMKTQTMEAESYQRAVALMIVQDMANRINGDRIRDGGRNDGLADLEKYTTGKLTVEPTGIQECSGTGSKLNLCLWANLLYGANEKRDQTATGGLIDAVGCIEKVTDVDLYKDSDLYKISVAWQGLVDTRVAPNESCGSEKNYGGDGYRRVVSVQIIPNLKKLEPKI
jgi:type IV pilus assembly protein PilV